jgi:hypothetical protein
MDETYGLVIYDETKNTHTISGEPFANFAVNKYQILRSTYCSFYWGTDSKYTLYFVKYKVPKKDYLIYAHQCLDNNWWQTNVQVAFKISHRNNPVINNELTAISTDSNWKLTFTVMNSVLALPYITKK